MGKYKRLVKDVKKAIEFGIEATDGGSEYELGMRNGMRYCLSLLDGKAPNFEESKENSMHYGCNSNGEHEKCKDCGTYDTCRVRDLFIFDSKTGKCINGYEFRM